MFTVAHEFFGQYMRYHRAMEKWKLMCDSKNDIFNRGLPRIVIVWSKSSGTGKSYWARQYFPHAYWNDVTNEKILWFDGYSGEDTIVFDEFDPTSVKYRLLLKLLDGGFLKLEGKGSRAAIAATKFIFTTNFDPDLWYVSPGGREPVELRRRLRESATIIELGKLNVDNTLNIISRRNAEGHPGAPDISALGPIIDTGGDL